MHNHRFLASGFTLLLLLIGQPLNAQSPEGLYGKPDPYSGTQPPASAASGKPEGATTQTAGVSDLDRDSMSLEFKEGSAKLSELQEKGVIDWVNRMQSNKKEIRAHVASWAKQISAAPTSKEQRLIDARNKSLEKILEAKGLKVAVNQTPWRCPSAAAHEICNVQLKNAKPSSSVIVFSPN